MSRLTINVACLFYTDDIPIQNDANSAGNTSLNAGQQQQLGSINEEQESDSNSAKAGAKPTKEGVSKHKAFGQLKKLIDRDKDSKDKDKDKDKEKEKEKSEKGSEKMEKELIKAASAIKSGLSDTKENMKKLIGKDKQKSLQTSTTTSSSVTTNHYDENNQTTHANNGDLKSSPLVIIKRSSDVIASESIDMTVLNEKQFSSESKEGGINGGSHGIISPFDSLNSDSESEVDHPHHQLSTSSSASVNINLMETNSKTNVQVSQI